MSTITLVAGITFASPLLLFTTSRPDQCGALNPFRLQNNLDHCGYPRRNRLTPRRLLFLHVLWRFCRLVAFFNNTLLRRRPTLSTMHLLGVAYVYCKVVQVHPIQGKAMSIANPSLRQGFKPVSLGMSSQAVPRRLMRAWRCRCRS